MNRAQGYGFGSSLFAAALLAGCSGSSGIATVTGQLQSGAYALDNPVVIAAAASGPSYRSYVHPDLTFEITVPAGGTYALSLASSTRSGTFSVISHIDVDTDDGLARFIVVDEAGTADVGVVSPVDWAASTTGGLQTMSQPSNVGSGKSGGNGKGDDDDGVPDDVGTCDNGVVVESATSKHIGGLKGGGGSGAGAPVVMDGGTVGNGNGGGETKVTICHIPPGNPSNAHTITIGAPAVPAHLAHGDYLGACLPTPVTPGPGCGNGGGSADGGTPGDNNPGGNGGGTPGGNLPGGSVDGGIGGGGGLPGGSLGGGADPSAHLPAGSTCQINADCATGLQCIQNICAIVVL